MNQRCLSFNKSIDTDVLSAGFYHLLSDVRSHFPAIEVPEQLQSAIEGFVSATDAIHQ